MNTESKNNLRIMLTEHWFSKNRTVTDFAQRLGVHRTLVTKYLNGERRPTLSKKIKIGEILGLDSRLIFPESEGK